MNPRIIVALAAICTAAFAQDKLLVVHKLDDSFGIYDASSGKLETRIPVGRKPHEFALSSDEKTAFVTNYGLDTWNSAEPGGNTITVIDLLARQAVGEIDMGEFRRPHGIVRGASGRLYVTTDLPAALHIIDAKKRKILYSIKLTGKLPHMVCVSSDERKAWTADAGSGTVTLVDLYYRRQSNTFAVGGAPMGVALSADEKRLFATTLTGNEVIWIDAVANTIRRRLGVPGGPSRLRVSPDGKRLFTSLITSGEVAVLDPQAFLEVKRVAVGQRVEGMTIDPAGEHLYISAQAENHIMKLEIPSLENVQVINAAGKPDPLLIWRAPSQSSK